MHIMGKSSRLEVLVVILNRILPFTSYVIFVQMISLYLSFLTWKSELTFHQHEKYIQNLSTTNKLIL